MQQDEHEIFMMIDDNGGCSVAMDRDDLDLGNHDDSVATRIIRLVIKTDRPTDTTVRVVVPAATPLTVAELLECEG